MDKKADLTRIEGERLSRFVLHSALLRLIDPVRGDPTRLLDESPDGSFLNASQLKQKFLDSFALISSTSRSGAKTATAVCLETNQQTGNVLRVARNHGLCPKDLAGLEKVLQILQEVARKGTQLLITVMDLTDMMRHAEKLSMQAEPEILRLVVELDRGRIMFIAGQIEKKGIRQSLQSLQSQRHNTGPSSKEFRCWLANHPFMTTLQNWGDATTTMLIEWAAQARWHHAEQLKSLLRDDNLQGKAWLGHLHKVARYYSAIKSMVKLAVREPELFMRISIRDIEAPAQLLFKYPNDEAPILAIVRRLMGKNANLMMEQLERRLSTTKIEARLRDACRLSMTLHAEMQLVVFYEGNPGLSPCMRFIGTSKKACFLCDRYMRSHPLKLQASACHQKIYPSWMPPPYYKIPGKPTGMVFMKLSQEIEKLTERELKTGLTALRRPWNHDSTAGPSLTLTATVPTELRSLEAKQENLIVLDGSLSDDSE
ncbi:hypothetical protein ACLX1H_008904 [Fusarium chlamydosporum]